MSDQNGNGQVIGKTRVLEQDDWPWTTQDAMLAFCLYMAGAPFLDDKHPCVCEYNLDILRKLAGQGLPVAGKPIEEAVDIAVARKKKGHVDYGFKRTDRLHALISAYMDQVKQIEEMNITGSELVMSLVEMLKMNRYPVDEFLVRLHCVACKMRGMFMDMWKDHVFIRIENAGETTSSEETIPSPRGPRKVKTVNSPGFKLYPRHASKKLRQEMNL